MKTGSFILSFVLFFVFLVQSQDQVNDTLLYIDGNYEPDTTADRIEYTPEDISLIPAEILYNHHWDNYNIRCGSGVLPATDDTVFIFLQNADESAYVHPVKGKVISGYRTKNRKYHTGTDIKLNRGDSVLCAFDGKVRLARVYSGYGKLVLVRHNNGLETVYSHLSKITVKENDIVCAGDLVGLGGRTGRATTDHLHFESRLFGEPFDSQKYIDFENFALKHDTLIYINRRVENNLYNFPAIKMKTTEDQQRDIVGSQDDIVYYKIRKGDTLYAIAKKYDTSVTDICQKNSISAKKVLRIGEVLIVK